MMKDPTKLTYITAISNYFWIIDIGGFRVGPNDNFSDGSNSVYALSKLNIAIVDTGTSLFYVPYSAFKTFVSTVFHNIPYQI